ncbi:TonB-dependent receptor [Sphingomonas gei]|nr:TonB-dependent receptor [Sphingomonas gei]
MSGFVGARAVHAQVAPQAGFSIPPQALGDALADFGQQSGLQISADAELVRGIDSPGASGQMSPAQALARLLAGSGLTYRINERVVTLVRASQVLGADDQQTIVTEALRVEGAAGARETGDERDGNRRDDVYALDSSTSFAGRAEVERYRGVSPSDMLKGLVNVFSGDARNSGALDPSIRGIQGPGRVPVIIDGSEQALTVWRGYNGASNRSYIDPSLIAGVQVLAGPVSDRGVRASIGGAVVVNTLDADDILKSGQTFGVELHLEGGNNSTDPRLPTLLTGQDYRTVPGFPGSPGTPGLPTTPLTDPSLRITPGPKSDNDFLSLGDRAARIAVAGRVGDFDLFGAYAYRERGNYFAGTGAAGYYSQEGLGTRPDTLLRQLALEFEPGTEVPNTSSKLESVLLKGTWRIADDQYLQLGFRDSSSTYGEIMPSRISLATGVGNVQWPLSHVDTRAYTAEYKWQPESRWIDLKANLWATDTASHTYTAGGFPNFASFDDPILRNTAINNSQNDRYGFTASNKFGLSSRLDLTLAGDWQHEKLTSSDPYTGKFDGWRQFPRAGRREEYSIRLDTEWRPTSFLKFNASVVHSGYWAVDDFLSRQIAAGNSSQFTAFGVTRYESTYRTEQFGADAYEAILREQFAELAEFEPELVEFLIADGLAQYNANPFPIITDHKGPDWTPDANGKFHRADNVCLNGTIAAIPGYSGFCALGGVTEPFTAEARRNRGSAWAPSFSATAYFSGSSRAYLRYAEAYRFPSLFESTIGFSASWNPLADLKPEHSHYYEAAFIQDLRDLFGLRQNDQRADLKLTYYNNRTTDVIERSTQLQFTNIDKQVIAGFELQARYDSGRFFTELSAAHMTTNKVCDESVAITRDALQGRVPDCVKYGFGGGYLLTQATPEDSVNWTVGGRFLEKRLEIGGRLIWYSGYDNPQLDTFLNGGEDVAIPGYALNIPYTWGEILTFDAYARFRLNDRFSAELVGTNLNNRFYVDPLTRTLNPAPGRTVRLSLTGRF